MIDLSTLSSPLGARKKRKRIGRGDASGHGGTSGKGHKGQKARSGGKVRRGFEGGQMPMARRLPKRGFNNPNKKDIITVNIGSLVGFPAGSVISEESLIANGIIKQNGNGIKLLGKGSLEKALTVSLDFVSKGAREKIIAAGGSLLAPPLEVK